MKVFSDMQCAIEAQRRPGVPPAAVVRRLAVLVALVCAASLPGADTGTDAASDSAHYVADASTLAAGTWYQRSAAADDLQAAGHKAAAAGPRLRQIVLDAVTGGDWRLAHLALETIAAVAPAELASCTAPIDAALHGDAQAQGQAMALIPVLGSAGAGLAPRLAELVDTPLGARALVALGAIGTAAPTVVPTLEAALASPQPALVHAAIAAFGAIGPKTDATLPDLVRLLTVPTYRHAVLTTLASFETAAASAVPQVVAAEDAAHGQDRGAFVRTLKRIETADIPPTIAPATARCSEGDTITVTPVLRDPDDLPETLRLQVAPGPVAQVEVDATQQSLRIHAAYGWTGTVQVPVTVSDGRQTSAAANITITVTPDTAAAQLLAAIRSTDGRHVLLQFDKPIDMHAVGDLHHYSLGASVRIAQASLGRDPRTVDLLVSGLPEDGSADLSITGLPDAAEHAVATTLAATHRILSTSLRGLHVQYFQDSQLLHPTDAADVLAVDFPSGPKPNTARYAACYTGMITAPATGTYALALSSDDGGRLFVDDKKVVDMWSIHSCETQRVTLNLVAGERHSLRIDYFQGGGGACLRLSWMPPGTQKLVAVPATALSHDATPLPDHASAR